MYIPSKNRELFDAAVIFWAIADKCTFPMEKDMSKYVIKTTDGGHYTVGVDLPQEQSDPDYIPTLKNQPNYWTCGSMHRGSDKYDKVSSWSIDTRLCSRKGAWQNNLVEDYDYIYELMKGTITEENNATSEKFARLRERSFLTSDGKPNIMIVKGDQNELFDKIPSLSPEIKDQFADIALESAMARAKDYPPQMQDFVVAQNVCGFFGGMTALMVMDILYSDGTFKPLTEEEKVTSTLLMFSDILPE